MSIFVLSLFEKSTEGSFAQPALEDNTFCALLEGFWESRKVFLA